MAIALSGPSKADELPRQAVKELIIHHSGESQHVDPALALAVARILSNFDAAAIGPAQRVGVFQLDHERLAGAHHKADLLDPYLNIKIGLQNLNHLIKTNDGDIATGLADFNNGLAIGPWPNTRILDTPHGFVANVFAARAVFQKELASHHHATRAPMQLSFYIQVQARMIFYISIVKISTCHDGAERFWKRSIGLVRQNASSAHKRGKQVLLISTDNTKR